MVGTESSRSSKTESKRMDEDPLDAIMMMMGYRFKKYILVLQIIFVISALYLEAFNVIYFARIFKGQWRYMHQYITLFFLQQPGCSGLLYGAYHITTALQWKPTFFKNFWPPNACGPDVENRILRESKLGNYICVFQTVYCVLVHILFLPIIGDESSIFFTIMFVEEECGKWKDVLKFFTYLSLVVSLEGLTIILCGGVYLCFHLRFQLYLLTEYVAKIAEDVESPDQELIFKRISICIAHHVRIRGVANNFMKISDTILLMIHITGTLAALSGLYFILVGISPRSNFRMVAIAMIAVIFSLVTCDYGQRLIDESNHFSSAIVSTPWVHWNQKNKKALLLLYMNSGKQFRLSCYGIVDMNYNFLLSFVRVVYSLIAVIMKMK